MMRRNVTSRMYTAVTFAILSGEISMKETYNGNYKDVRGAVSLDARKNPKTLLIYVFVG